MAKETEAEFNARMAQIRETGPKQSRISKAQTSRTNPLTSAKQGFGATFAPQPEKAPVVSMPIENLSDEEAKEAEAKGLSGFAEAEEKAEQTYLAIIERRIEQGLAHYPFPDKITLGFVRLGDDNKPYNPNIKEVLRLVSGWFVKKDNKFHDVNNLQTTYQAQDLKQVIVHRIKVVFPKLNLSNKDLKDLFLLLLDPPIANANPEENVAVWSGRTTNLPNKTQKISFKDGVATVNLWEYPAYRRVEGEKATAFDEFLAYVIPDNAERDVFLNWLAWSLKHEEQKPRWAVMLYSQKQGTGKTVLTELVKDLFGVANTSRINGVRQLVARFNKEVLRGFNSPVEHAGYLL